MPDSLGELLTRDREARAFFDSLPMFIQDQARQSAACIETREELSGFANEAARSALKLPQYRPMFEDETDSGADLM
ncbi:hypothetical protein ACH6CV_11605 [Bacillota bacterium Meth-B3]|nr:hypothetical protein [Christensenellaceae bacterium]MEA5065143.1 hypothetical protein [Eubacteriales bacterium]MEA5070075.1 hypothetical protein [Christensenellaceae bacterium]